MNDSIYLSIQNSSRFKELVSKRERFAWILSAIMLGLYSGFILLIAYGPHVLGPNSVLNHPSPGAFPLVSG
ncbi:Inner membrane protein YjcH [Pseudomonas chlororaphis subsp. aurantiaca]|nr:Inner membrane protein YjcH [Pseudomonas chlororaphis subsp. aurantiaca]